MGGPPSPDVSAAPPPAEVGPSAPSPGATESGGPSPADVAANTALADSVIGAAGDPVEDALPPAVDNAFAAAAGISPDAVPPSDAVAPEGPEVTPPAGAEPGADGATIDAAAATATEPAPATTTEQTIAALSAKIAEDLATLQAAQQTTEAAKTGKPYLETVIDLSGHLLEAERLLAEAEKTGAPNAPEMAKARDEIRAELNNEMATRDRRPIEDRISEARLLRTDAEFKLKQARAGGKKDDIDAAQARLDAVSRYTQVVEAEKKKTLKQLFTQLLKALGLTGIFLGGQAKEQAEAGASASGTSTGQGR